MSNVEHQDPNFDALEAELEKMSEDEIAEAVSAATLQSGLSTATFERIDIDNTLNQDTSQEVPVSRMIEASKIGLADRQPLSENAGQPNPKDALGRVKVPFHYIPPVALVHLGLAMENGGGKYGLFNWREHPVQAEIYYDAAQRHMMAWLDGDDFADDSGISHLGHAMACLAIILDAEDRGNLIDIRNDKNKGGFTEMIDRLHAERKARQETQR